jgi:hypothetical protein
MQVFDVEQGSPEWHELRGKYPTASCFDKILTPTGKKSTQADDYANQIVANLLGCDKETVSGIKWTERGTEQEPFAIEYYEYIYGNAVKKIGFVVDDDNLAGCSPDGLIGEDGMLEVKTPSSNNFIDYVLSGKAEQYHRPQIQGGLWITKRKWCDLLVYNEKLTPHVFRVERNEEYINLLKNEIIIFNNIIKEKLKCLTKM